MLLTSFKVLLIFNALWFGMAFWFFSLQSKKAAKLLVRRENRDEVIYPLLSYSLKFLGGMNLSIGLYALLLVFNTSILVSPILNSLLSLFFALANFSQFYFNIPLAWAEWRQKKMIWPVLRGRMFFIFVTYGLLFFLDTFWALLFIST